MGYKIGSFNMKNLSFASDKNYKKIAEIILSEKFDIVAMQEILSEGKAIKRILLGYLGRNWRMSWGNAESQTDSRGEGYSFIWNSNRVNLSKSITSIGTEEFLPRIYKEHKGTLVRHPYYARFTPNGKIGGCFCEIRLICAHVYYGSNSLVDVIVRRKEFDILVNEIYPRIADRIYGNNMPAYTILLGDYNMNLQRPWNNSPYLKEIAIISDQGKIKQIKTFQDQPTTLKLSERGYANNYDHFSYDINRFELLDVKHQKVDAVRKYYNDNFEKYKNDISDHVPVLMDINLK